MKSIYALLILILLVSLTVGQGLHIGQGARVGTVISINGGGGFTPFSAGFDFRSTSGYVTDSAGYTYVLKTDTYPTTRGGFTFGWVLDNQNTFDADRNNTFDARIAGINFVSGANTGTPIGNTYFRVDLLSAGTYSIELAIGDTSAQTNQYVSVRDTTTALFVVGPANTSASHWLDANATDLTNVTWPTTEAAKTGQVFATTQLRLYPGNITSTDATTVSHLRIVRTA